MSEQKSISAGTLRVIADHAGVGQSRQPGLVNFNDDIFEPKVSSPLANGQRPFLSSSHEQYSHLRSLQYIDCTRTKGLGSLLI